MALALLALPLAACGSGDIRSAGSVAASASDHVERAEARYEAAKAFADMLAPFLSPERAALVRAIEAKVELALFAAKTATTSAEQIAALAEAHAETDKLADPG